ncbi:MAG: type II toxin-antitoxin system Phd/YefM family antitoxin [Bryobacterales bacterium]|nr:type II toxin-antitoxin system Phd/YefM family antitoxin [Bryobacterales bacterium]
MRASVYEAKTNLSRYLEKVLLGEEIIITKSGRPIARLVPIESRKTQRKVGSARGEFEVPADFTAPLDNETEGGFWR